jgi:3-phenylpropionate/trans-cinnamate dioxygenase ferredoxin subunit/naphthalene 1,2-dioxygenase system ferredoxin subunit
VSEWIDLIARDALEPADVTPVTFRGRRLAVYDAPDGIYVTLALCTHGGADLCDGYFDGHMIECPLHQGLFDIRDGRPVGAPVTRPLKTFPAREVGGRVQVKL